MMSDENPQTPQGQPPAPPQGGMAPPPPPPPSAAPVAYPPQPAPAPQPAYAPPAPQQPPQLQPGTPQYAAAAPQPPAAPPKKRKGWVIALVIALVLLCGIGSCAGLFALGVFGSKDKDSITQAETHYSAAQEAVTKADESIKTAASGQSPEQIAAAVDGSTKMVRVSRDEIAAAKASIEQIKDSQGKTDYLASLAAATAALDGLQDLLVYMNTASGMSSKAGEAGDLTKTANADLESAISLANKSSYTAMRAKAAAASALYIKAALLFEEADKLDPSAGLKKAATYANNRRRQADVVVRMADEGKAGRLSAYNADIKKQAALGKAAEAAGIPAIVSDPDWAKNRLLELSKTIDAQATKADVLHKKAFTELTQ